MQTAIPGWLKTPTTDDWIERLHAPTIGDLMRRRATSDRKFVFLDDKGNPTNLNYGIVARMAGHYSKVFQARGVKPGDRVVLMLPTCPEYLYTFFGIILAGGIPVPVYPPINPNQLITFLHTLTGVFENSQAIAMVFWKDVKPVIGEALARAPSVKIALSLDEFETADGKVPESFDAPDVHLDPNATAMIQYTSGSTDQPKGVELSHLNLLHNMHSALERLKLDSETDTVVSWLPLYHDMGLIGVMIGAIYSHIQLVLMGPQTFLMRPRIWLQAISQYKATITVAPNFAFNLCVNRISDKALEGLDLSSLRIAMCGAEPIRRETVEAFMDKFKPHGFIREAFFPVYGMAESTLGTTFPPIFTEPTVRFIDREILESEHRAMVVSKDAPQAMAAYGCGQPFAGSQVRIVDPETFRLLEEGQIGEIQLKGPSVMKGYFRNPQKTAETLINGWLRTGDLGFALDDHLFISGRLKDLIIRNGRNYYPQDMEFVVESVDGIRKGCVIAFGHQSRKGTEEIVILAESRQVRPEEREALAASVRETMNALLGLVPDDVRILPPHTLLKTSSGKLRRRPTRDLFLTGNLRARKDGVLQQFRVLAKSQIHWSKRRLEAIFITGPH